MTIVLVSLGAAVVGLGDNGVDPSPYLKQRKMRKFMGKQDELAVVATGRALGGLFSEANGIVRPTDWGAESGLYVGVGYIPFEGADIEPVLKDSIDERGEFSMSRFSSEGLGRAHPLLTFRCLPNMPAFHVSYHFGITGRYQVLYPSIAELYLALEEAVYALEQQEITHALLLGVAAQRNFLVMHHLARQVNAPEPDSIVDAAGSLVLCTEETAVALGYPIMAYLKNVTIRTKGEAGLAQHTGEMLRYGVASLPVFLQANMAQQAECVHQMISVEGVEVQSTWCKP